ncbi:MAG: hypothetical protein IKZ81_00615 [Clostridia bacterium]|nr:hypothetical protein [Clostridia bacterium]
MNNGEKSTHYYLGANSGEGFVSHFDELDCLAGLNRKIIIKGGPGTGKSRMIRRVAEHYESMGKGIEYIHCSSDPDSLDGIIVGELGICIADGTAPHVLEPDLPGVRDSIVNTGDFWDEKALAASADAVTDLKKRIKHEYNSVYRALKGAERLKSDNFNIVDAAVKREKLKAYTQRLIRREIAFSADPSPYYSRRYLSGITPLGVLIFWNTVRTLCDRVYVINDEYGIGRYILEELRTAAVMRRQSVIACLCPLYEEEAIEHLILPDLKLAFVTSNEYHAFPDEPYKRINMQRFYDGEAVRARRNRIRFNKKTAAALIDKSCETLAGIKRMHDKLEGYYTRSMDFAKLEGLTRSVIDRLDSFVEV